MARGHVRAVVLVWLVGALLVAATASPDAAVSVEKLSTRKASTPPSIAGDGRASRSPLGVAFAATSSPSSPPPTTEAPSTTQVPTASVAGTPGEGSIAFHRQEYERLSAEIEALESELDAMEKQLKIVDDAIAAEWSTFEEQFDTITRSALPSPRGARVRNLRCMGWKKASMCQWRGKRDPVGDKSCFAPIVDSSVGFCVVRDEDTDEYFRVMRSDCAAIAPRAFMSCRYAHAFANFPAEIERLVLEFDTDNQAPEQATSPKTTRSNGIVVMLHPSQAQHAEALVLALRSHDCQLPVELWSVDETSPLDALAAKLTTTQAPVTARALELRSSWYEARVHAISNSAFDQVLYLDTNTIPLRDPTYLFALPEFAKTGALFWPDLFHPGTTDSNIQPTSLLWEYLDMPFANMFEQDDRQLLVRRDTLQTTRGLRLVNLFATHVPSIFSILNLVKDSKDFFRLAWLKARLPFSMVEVPPSIGGEAAPREPYKLCGTHVVQRDPAGEMLFLHRQSDAIESAKRDTFVYLQSFEWHEDGTDADAADRQSPRDFLMRAYQVTTFRATESETPRCYGFLSNTDPTSKWRVTTTRWEEIQPTAVVAIER